MRQLFISYARENKPDVEALVRDLDALGYDVARFVAALNPATSGTVIAARTACRSASRSGSWGDLLTSLSECREGVDCNAFGVVGVELQSVVDSDDPFGLLAWQQFGRTVQRSGLSGAVMYLTSPFDT
jgi:hypothetical protein